MVRTKEMYYIIRVSRNTDCFEHVPGENFVFFFMEKIDILGTALWKCTLL